jgi:PAS domain S-box-containing protein
MRPLYPISNRVKGRKVAAVTSELRKTEIGGVGDIAWGTHFCHFYETEADLLDILIPYYKAGLENNEFCIWVVSDPLNEEAARNALRRAIPEADQHLAAGRIEIVPHTEWYLKDGALDLERVIRGWEEKLTEALAKGYAGMRANGDAAWLTEKDWRDFLEYEKKLNQMVANQRMIVLCTYPLALSPAAEIFDVARSHEFAIARRNGKWEVLETPELKQAKVEIKRLNDELEQRVVERTRELAATNEELRREIAERQRAEEALREQKRFLHQIAELTPVVLNVFDLVTERDTYISPDVVNLLGYTADEIAQMGDPISPFWHPDDIPIAREHLARSKGAADGEINQFEYRVRRRDGEWRWLATRSMPFARNDAGEVRQIVTATLDVTERKRAEEELRKQNEVLKTIINNIPVMIRFLGPDNRVQLVNRAWERTLGWSLEEVQLRNFDLFNELYTDPQERQRALEFVAAATGEWADFRIRVRDGRMIDGTFANIRLSDGTNISIGQDITERKRVEGALRASSEQLRALSSSLSFAREEEGARIARELHDELGSALTSLKWDLEAIDKLCSAAGKQTDLAMLWEKIKVMTALIDTTLNTVKRISSELRPGILDDLGLVAAIEWQAQQFEARTGIPCQFDALVDNGFSRELGTAAFRIFQEALTNILRHAQASRVNVMLEEEAGEFVLEVRDNGRGITEAEKSASGSLGLIGMRERAHLVGGQIDIVGVRGKGTVLTLRVPLPGQAADQKAALASENKIPTRQPGLVPEEEP